MNVKSVLMRPSIYEILRSQHISKVQQSHQQTLTLNSPKIVSCNDVYNEQDTIGTTDSKAMNLFRSYELQTKRFDIKDYEKGKSNAVK